MSDKCKGALKAAVKGAFSDQEVETIALRLAQKRAKLKQAAPSLAEHQAIKLAAKELTVDEVRAALVSQRAAAFSAIARTKREAIYGRMSGTEADKLEAVTIGNDKAGFGGAMGVDQMGQAYASELVGGLERGMRAAGLWKRVTRGLRDVAWEERIATEMARLNGADAPATGDASAFEAAKVIAPLIERGRMMQNGVGAYVRKLPGYVVRQNHDPVKVAGGFFRDIGKVTDGQLNDVQTQAFNDWHDFIAPRLDDATFDGIAPEDRRAFLTGVWYNIVTGSHVEGGSKIIDEVTGFLPKGGRARSASAERVLHFKGPKDWWDYHQTYGKGGLFAVVAQDLQRSARNTALMEMFGPNPEIAFENDLKRFDAKARDRGDARTGAKINGRGVRSAFDTVAGLTDAPENLRLAYVGALLRRWESVTKLGAMVLSAFGDVGAGTTHLMQWGVPFLESYGDVFGGILRLGGAERKQAAETLDVMARSAAGHLLSGVTLKDGALGVATYLGRINYDIQGFTAWNDGLRAGTAVGLSRHLGRQAKHAFSELPGPVREGLERYGIDAAGWDRMREAVQTFEGVPHLGFDGLDGATALRARAMVNDVMDNATSEARGREHRTLTQGVAAGSLPGEALRAIFQFKSFPLTLYNRTLMPAVRSARGGNVAPLANLIVSTLILGYLSMQAKEIAKGRNPRPLDARTVAAAMVQGGGLGIYGDFLFGEKNRFGGGLLETFGGPLVGDFATLYGLFGEAKGSLSGRTDGQRASSRRQVTGDAFRLARGQLPFANLWFARAALDYLIFDRMQEAISPGWAKRYQDRVERDNGQSFWLKPTDAVQ